MNIGFVGAGKVGSAFGHYLRDQGMNVVGYSSRTLSAAKAAAEFTGTEYMDLETLVQRCDHVFITTQDNEIINVWNQIKGSHLQDKKIFHMSGSLSSEIFDGIEGCRAFGYSLHPLFPFTDKFAYRRLDQAVFTVEGTDIAFIDMFLNTSRIKWFAIDRAEKGKYHAAAVFASNYVTALADMAKTLFTDSGLPGNVAELAISSLMEGAIENIKSNGIKPSLTGPCVRGDVQTIKTHLEAIDDALLNQVYRGLGKVAASIANCNGNINNEKANEIFEILGGDLNEPYSSNI